MEEQPTQGVNKTTVLLAVISGVQAIFLALVGTGQVPTFASPGEKATAAPTNETAPAAEAVAASSGSPEIFVDGFDLAPQTGLTVAQCLDRSQTALEGAEFSAPADPDDGVRTMDKGDLRALVWCYTGDYDGLFFAVAGPAGGDTQQELRAINTRLTSEFGNEMPSAE